MAKVALADNAGRMAAIRQKRVAAQLADASKVLAKAAALWLRKDRNPIVGSVATGNRWEPLERFPFTLTIKSHGL